ncbi:hypothetical protein KY284_003119 [Solanum tuberosum]|nr:hypothetical protein KY284_003119 [Solanum tuberosum]
MSRRLASQERVQFTELSELESEYYTAFEKHGARRDWSQAWKGEPDFRKADYLLGESRGRYGIDQNGTPKELAAEPYEVTPHNDCVQSQI